VPEINKAREQPQEIEQTQHAVGTRSLFQKDSKVTQRMAQDKQQKHDAHGSDDISYQRHD
jgi:hypothetical protein